VRRKIKDSVAVITGGTGSFGSTMARYLLSKEIGELRIFSRDESKQDAMRHTLADVRVRYFIGDVRDEHSVQNVVKGADFIFHAAALKQVPSAEFFPLEAVKTNIYGSANVLRSAIENKVKSVVCLSTDKAVYPINAMGMSKALMEKTAQSFARDNLESDTVVSITRYGNVMFSRGSVIPLFISQVLAGKPITVTDPNMTRFLMSLGESVQLVEYAFENAKNGDLFVKKAPSCSLEILSQAIIELFGEAKQQRKILGFRHGEKLFESLLSAEERASAEDLDSFFRVPLDSRTLDYSEFFESGQQRSAGIEPYTSHNTKLLGVEEVKQLLLTLPEVKELKLKRG